ncbi:hypothetical protein AVEN_194800-1 [Araneus ventricosus]|uniref:Uncharacterized protein n=1 Tax=Araneus ventricosus TaxID=182803 RepID=A0A4Y2B2I7_ARAVE|nr:hypothetical protein AVEN_194800-1 [Araneus ventricosus]
MKCTSLAAYPSTQLFRKESGLSTYSMPLPPHSFSYFVRLMRKDGHLSPEEDDIQVWAINCQQRKEPLFSRKIFSGARNRLSPVSVEWGGLRRIRAHRVNQLFIRHKQRRASSKTYTSTSVVFRAPRDSRLVSTRLTTSTFSDNEGLIIKYAKLATARGPEASVEWGGLRRDRAHRVKEYNNASTQRN